MRKSFTLLMLLVWPLSIATAADGLTLLGTALDGAERARPLREVGSELAALPSFTDVANSTTVLLATGRSETGEASYYGPGFYGNLTANGERFSHGDPEYTAAHKTIPFNTRVTVTNLNTGRSIEVRINDRGPYVAGRIIDLNVSAAEALGVIQPGHVPVRLDW